MNGRRGRDAALAARDIIEYADMPDADVRVYPCYFSTRDADRLLRALTRDTAWVQERVTMYGKTHDVPRLTAWHGDPNATYRYAGITLDPRPWTTGLLDIKQAIETVSGVAFNSVLLNWYRNGSDGVAWHSDDEAELGDAPVIGSVSFGATRAFQMKHKTRPDDRRTIRLGHGSYLLMCGPTQRHWLHRIPRVAHDVGGRVNLTFRIVR